MKRWMAMLLAGVVALLVLASIGGAAPPFNHATGDIWMTGPSQHAEFAVFDYGSTGDRGWVSYENFDYPGGLSYTANVLCANVDPAHGWARFVFQIPTGWPGLSGLYVGVQVSDDGSPGEGNDTWGHTVVTGTSWCATGGGVGNYPITAGNLVVHGAP